MCVYNIVMFFPYIVLFMLLLLYVICPYFYMLL